MGLPEERGRSGSGSGGREEAAARTRVRSWSPPTEISRSAHVPSLQRYRELHRRSVEEPRGEAGRGVPGDVCEERGGGSLGSEELGGIPWGKWGFREEMEVSWGC